MIVVLGLLDKGKGAAVVAGVTAMAASAPFVPRLVHYVIDPANYYGYSRRQLQEIELLVERHRDELVSAWHQHFGS